MDVGQKVQLMIEFFKAIDLKEEPRIRERMRNKIEKMLEQN